MIECPHIDNVQYRSWFCGSFISLILCYVLMSLCIYRWNFRNPALFKNFALTIAKLRPATEVERSLSRRLLSHLNPTSNLANTPAAVTSASSSSVTSGRELTVSGSSKLIVYYSRRSSSTMHGRIIPKQEEDYLIATISKLTCVCVCVFWWGVCLDFYKYTITSQ
jgi:hypothetical protein